MKNRVSENGHNKTDLQQSANCRPEGFIALRFRIYSRVKRFLECSDILLLLHNKSAGTLQLRPPYRHRNAFLPLVSYPRSRIQNCRDSREQESWRRSRTAPYASEANRALKHDDSLHRRYRIDTVVHPHQRKQPERLCAKTADITNLSH